MTHFSKLALSLSFLSFGALQACNSDVSVSEPLRPVSESNDLNTVTIKSDTGTTLSLQQKSTQTEALKITDGIYQATGFGNSFLVVTDEGNVVIDTSLARNAGDHKALLDAVSNEVPKYIIATHAHGDHVGGIPIWRGPETEVIAQESSVEFRHYQTRLSGFFARRNAAQFGLGLVEAGGTLPQLGNFDAVIPSTITFDKEYQFELGGLGFELASAPAETYDALTVYIPQKRAVFVGDLVYESFPNIYTLRGTKPRWALDYVNAIDDVLALNAEIMIPSHGEAIKGAAEIKSVLTRYRDAILYVHDATVAGMNAGKDVYTLMDEIKLPENLAMSEEYGTVKWTVRGIYDGYAGWFDGNPSTMLAIKPNAADQTLVKMAGGAGAVIATATAQFKAGNTLEALALTEAVLSVEPNHRLASQLRLEIMTKLHAESRNFNEAGWLGHGKRQSEAALDGH